MLQYVLLLVLLPKFDIVRNYVGLYKDLNLQLSGKILNGVM
jgi:hypothetical protein